MPVTYLFEVSLNYFNSDNPSDVQDCIVLIDAENEEQATRNGVRLALDILPPNTYFSDIYCQRV